MSHPPNAASDIQGSGSANEPTEAPKERSHAYERVPLPQGPVAGLPAVAQGGPVFNDGRKK